MMSTFWKERLWVDIEVHRKVELQDTDITEAQQNAFKDLCVEFNDIFSTDSSDIKKTPLLEVEIDTGDNLAITQKPYTLPLKHTTWVQRELEILEKAGVIVRSVSPWVSPIAVVPKRTAQGNPLSKAYVLTIKLSIVCYPP